MEVDGDRLSAASSARVGKTRSAQLLRFLNSLQLTQPLTPANIADEFRSGILLCALVQHLAPDVQILGINKKVLSKQPALNNIEKALSIIWKRSRRAQYIPSAEEIYEKKPEKVYSLLHEVVEAFVLSDARGAAVAKEMRRFYGDALRPYGKLLSHHAFSFAKKGGEALLWEDFGSGAALACVLHRHIACKAQRPVAQYPKLPVPEHIPDLSRVYCQPENEEEARANVGYVLELLRMNGLPCFWTVDEFFAKQRDDEFLLLQLHALFRVFSAAGDPGPDPTGVQFLDERRTRGREQRRQREIEGRRAELAVLEGRRLEEELVKYAEPQAGPAIAALAESQERLRRLEAASPRAPGFAPSARPGPRQPAAAAGVGAGRGGAGGSVGSGAGARALEQLSRQQEAEERGVSPTRRRAEEELFRRAARLNELEPKFEMLKTAIERRRAEADGRGAGPGALPVPGPLPSEGFAREREGGAGEHPYAEQVRELEAMVSRADREMRSELAAAAAGDAAVEEQARRVAEQVEALKAGEARLLAQVNRELGELQAKVALLGEQLEKSRRDTARERALRDRAEERAAAAEQQLQGGAGAGAQLEQARRELAGRASSSTRRASSSRPPRASALPPSASARRWRGASRPSPSSPMRRGSGRGVRAAGAGAGGAAGGGGAAARGAQGALAAGESSHADDLRRELADLKAAKDEAERKAERAAAEARKEARKEAAAELAARTAAEQIGALRGEMEGAEQLKRDHAAVSRQADALRRAAAETAAERDALAARPAPHPRPPRPPAPEAAAGASAGEARGGGGGGAAGGGAAGREAAEQGDEGRERAERLERRAAAAAEEATRFEREAREADRRGREAARAAEEAIEALEAVERERDKLAAERDSLRQELYGVKEAMQAENREIVAKVQELEGRRADTDALRKAAANAHAEAAAHAKAAEASAAKLEEMRRERDRLHAESVSLEYQLKMAQAQLEALEAESRAGGDAQHAAAALRGELARGAAERAALQQEVEALRQEQAAAGKVVEQLILLRDENEALTRRLFAAKEAARGGADGKQLEALLQSGTHRSLAGSQGRASGAAAKAATPRGTPRARRAPTRRRWAASSSCCASAAQEVARLQQENVSLLQAVLKEPRGEERGGARVSELEGAIARLQAENEELQWFKLETFKRASASPRDFERTAGELQRQLEAAERRAATAELRLATVARASPAALSPRTLAAVAPSGPTAALSPRSSGSAFAAPGAVRGAPLGAAATPAKGASGTPPGDELVVMAAGPEGGLQRKATNVSAPRPAGSSARSLSARSLPGGPSVDLTDA
eukprot:tig00001029_g6430.t2